LISELDPRYSKHLAGGTRCDAVVVGIDDEPRHVIELKFQPRSGRTLGAVCVTLCDQICGMVDKELALRKGAPTRTPVAVSVIVATSEYGASDFLVQNLFQSGRVLSHLKAVNCEVNLVIIQIPVVPAANITHSAATQGRLIDLSV
jgi:hypothetical protein